MLDDLGMVVCEVRDVAFSHLTQPGPNFFADEGGKRRTKRPFTNTKSR